MTQAGDSILVTPGSGATVATHTVNSKEHQVMMLADTSGHLHGSLPTYMYSTPTTAVGASKLYFDLWNGDVTKKISIRGLWIVPKMDVTSSPTTGCRVDVYRTSAIGGGTGFLHNYKSATPDPTGGNVTPMDTTNAALPAGITFRWLPSTGATPAEWLFPTYVSPGSGPTSFGFLSQYANLIPVLTVGQKLVIEPGEGLLLKHFTIAGTGTLGFFMAFSVEDV